MSKRKQLGCVPFLLLGGVASLPTYFFVRWAANPESNFRELYRSVVYSPEFVAGVAALVIGILISSFLWITWGEDENDSDQGVL